MSDIDPEDSINSSDPSPHDAGSDAAEKAREILDRIKESAPGEESTAPELDVPATAPDSWDAPADDTPPDDKGTESIGSMEGAGIAGSTDAAEGMADRPRDALDDLLDEEDEATLDDLAVEEMPPIEPEPPVEHLVGTTGGETVGNTSWIGWMLGAVGLVLLLALLVSQCAAATTEMIEEGAAAHVVASLI